MRVPGAGLSHPALYTGRVGRLSQVPKFAGYSIPRMAPPSPMATQVRSDPIRASSGCDRPWTRTRSGYDHVQSASTGRCRDANVRSRSSDTPRVLAMARGVPTRRPCKLRGSTGDGVGTQRADGPGHQPDGAHTQSKQDTGVNTLGLDGRYSVGQDVCVRSHDTG